MTEEERRVWQSGFHLALWEGDLLKAEKLSYMRGNRTVQVDNSNVSMW